MLEGALLLWDLDTLTQLRYLVATSNSITYLAFTKQHLVLFTYDGEIILLDRETWKQVAKIVTPHYSVCAAPP